MDLGLLNTPIQSTVTCYMYPIVCKGDKSPDLYWQQGEPEEQPISLVYRNTTSPDGPLNKRVQWTPVLLYPHKYRGSYAPTVPWGSYPTPNLIEYDPNNSMQDALANASKILEKLQPPFYSNYTIVPASMTVNSSQLLYAAYAPHTPLLSSEGAKRLLYVQGVYSRIAASLVGKSDQFSFANICDALTWISDSLRNGIIGVSPERKELITFFEEIDKTLKNN